MQVKKQQSEPDMEQWKGSKLGQEYLKVKSSHPAYLTYIESTSLEMLDCKDQKLDSGFLGEISITSDMQMKVNEESEKSGLKLNTYKTNIMAFGPITSW